MYVCVYIVIYRQTVSLYHNSSVWLDNEIFQAGIETRLTHTPAEDSTAQL